MSEEQSNNKDLSYFVTEKAHILVASFAGPITKSGTAIIEKCQAELMKSSADKVIVSLHDVDLVAINGLPPFVKLQESIRKKPAELRLCFIKPDVYRVLDERGAIQKKEVMRDLKEAIQSLI